MQKPEGSPKTRAAPGGGAAPEQTEILMLVRPPTIPPPTETAAARRRARIRARDFETRMRRQRSGVRARGPATGVASLLDRILAPLTSAGTRLRGARLFHPTGALVRGEATAIASEPALTATAARLAGPVLMRFSGGWWKEREWPDLLGVALRFTQAPNAETAGPDDQDLLMITARSLLRLPIAPLFTHHHDYLDNEYFGAAPFAVDGIGEAELRLVPRARPSDDLDDREDRNQRIQREAASAGVVLQLDVRPRHSAAWLPVVEIRLTASSDLDAGRLRFSPFRDGRGLQPVGFVHRLRQRTYAWSQAARGAGPGRGDRHPPHGRHAGR
jgi:hypothetical protein